MNRDDMLGPIEDGVLWDILVIGGGATGLGVAVDAAARGHRTLLLEAGDFARGTSSRSTKLVHGGVRYLRQGNMKLVRDALLERARLRGNAPHLVKDLAFVVPAYRFYEPAYYGVGLRLYDALAGRHGFGPSRNLSRDETLERIPTLEPKGLRGGILYHDAQFDDARLAINLAQTAVDHGATVLNYCEVTGMLRENGRVTGVVAVDHEKGREHTLRARCVVNATGPQVDSIRRLDDPASPPLVVLSQGAHVVLDAPFLPGSHALMVPRTDDGRVLFAIPWHGRVLVGTTDTPLPQWPVDPKPLPGELRFLLEHAARYLTRDPVRDDALSVFAGVRPLVVGKQGAATAVLSRDHTLVVSPAGLVTITGGKWTTYRRMAEDTVNRAESVGGLTHRPCITADLAIHGAADPETRGDLSVYGTDAQALRELIESEPRFAQRLHGRFTIRAGEVVWAARHEMARTVEDFLARRSRALLLDARASVEVAPAVAALMAEVLGWDESWERYQVAAYARLAEGYVAE